MCNFCASSINNEPKATELCAPQQGSHCAGEKKAAPSLKPLRAAPHAPPAMRWAVCTACARVENSTNQNSWGRPNPLTCTPGSRAGSCRGLGRSKHSEGLGAAPAPELLHPAAGRAAAGAWDAANPLKDLEPPQLLNFYTRQQGG